MNNTLIIFVNPDHDRNSLIKRLQFIFKKSITIVGRSFETYKEGENPPLVLSGESTINQASKYYPNSKIVFISRCNSNINIEELIMLPKGTKVLVANEPRSAAFETIDDIKRMGIDHLHLEPYWPGKENYDSNIDIVVFAGYREHCPPGHARYINIGQRDINFSVTAAVIQAYHLPLSILDVIQQETNLRFVDAAYRIDSYFRQSESAKDSFKAICQLSENALIVTDEKDNISYFNAASESFFALKSDDIIGERLHKIFSGYPSLLGLYSSTDNHARRVITLHHNRAVVNVQAVDGNSDMKKIISIVPESEIQKRDAQIRKEIKESGYKAKYTFEDIIGDAPQMKEAIQLAKHYANSDASVYISGESGSGKELFAQSIHNLSERREFPFVSVNCAALPDSLAESELFGYEEGAFTGASKGGKSGKFELAHRGTIFLDEIGDTPLTLQTKLLRVIEEQEVVRIGSNKVIPIDVRIICASNKNLKEMVADGLFREDLYYRINVLPLKVPSLRDRREDIPAISVSLFDKVGMEDSPLRDYFIRKLMNYEWHGNVRELRSAVQLLSTLSDISDGDTNQVDEQYWQNIFDKHFDSQPDIPSEDVAAPVDLKSLVLKTIDRKSQEGIAFGRGAILKDVTLKANGLTEYRLKKFIAEFADSGLITIGSTKQGMRITEKGRRTLTK